MKFSFLCFGFCLALSVVSFADAELSKGVIQLLCALVNVPGMFLD